MSLRALLALSLALLAGPLPLLAEEEGPRVDDARATRYEPARGIVTYRLDGVEQGTETLYFDRHGRIEASWTESTTRIGGLELQKKELRLTEGFVVTSVDLAKKQGVKVLKNPLEQTLETAKASNLLELQPVILERIGARPAGTETVVGKPCEIWAANNQKLWIWQGLTLRSETGVAGQVRTKIATSVEIGAEIPPERLKLPEGVTLREIGNVR